MKLRQVCQAVSLALIATTVWGQQPPRERVEVTGSNIRRVAQEGAAPLQIISRQELEKRGITSAEQLVFELAANANGLDNLASNGDVVSGAARGNNGASSANLRNQGANATLILLNGRRVAAHGLNGGVVDLNQVPMSALDRVEILLDGASAIYGSDAVGGVINFITRRDFKGLDLTVSADVPEEKGGEIYRFSATGGWGDLERDRFNVMGTFTHRDAKALTGDQRDFVNTFQANRGLHVDTRGTPLATVFPVSTVRNILASRTTPGGAINNGTGPTLPGGTLAMSGGINILDLPGGAGCNSMPNSDAYDHVLWSVANAQFACAWDTGEATVLQQPVKDTNFVGRAAFKFAPTHTVFGELMASNVETKKSFSNNQISVSTNSALPTFNLLYPSTGSAYNRVFNAIVAVFPTIEENRGQGIAFRWRCMECGRRELETEAKADRILVGLEGSFGNWDYKTALARARSDVVTTIGGGYYFDDQFFPLLRNGILNPFLLPGESQTPEAMAALEAASARGVKLYGGEFTATTFDASIAGPVWKLPAGEMMVAFGVDLRQEEYEFQGDERDLANQRNIFNVPFDNVNALSGVDRDIKAFYAEALIPILRNLELTAAVRRDDYTGFGSTTNPKVTLRYQPTERVVLRGGYNTGFRVPTFNQLFNGITLSPFAGATLVDFSKCPAGIVSTTPGCESIRPTVATGGMPTLGPEESEQWNVGVVFGLGNNFSVSVDYWDIKREGTIQLFDLTTLSRNFALFPDRFLRDAAGNLIGIDNRWVNAGETVTKGVDIGVRWNGRVGPGNFLFSLDGTYLDEKKSRVLASAPFGPSEVGVFTRSGDLGLVWKHNATFTYSQGPWAASLTQIYRSGYDDFVLPGVANGTVRPPDWDPKVDDYWVHNVAVSYSGFKGFTIIGGIKNIFNEDPPFTVAYDSNTGAGSSWEPRVADPRGRAYTLTVTYRF